MPRLLKSGHRHFNALGPVPPPATVCSFLVERWTLTTPARKEQPSGAKKSMRRLPSGAGKDFTTSDESHPSPSRAYRPRHRCLLFRHARGSVGVFAWIARERTQPSAADTWKSSRRIRRALQSAGADAAPSYRGVVQPVLFRMPRKGSSLPVGFPPLGVRARGTRFLRHLQEARR